MRQEKSAARKSTERHSNPEKKALLKKSGAAKPAAPLRAVSDTARCPHEKRCGGCSYSALPYEEQLRKKQRQAEKLLGKFCKVEPIVAAAEPLHYRNKVTASFGFQNKKLVVGVYERDSHRVVPIDHCRIQNRTADRIIHIIRDLAVSFRLKAYDEDLRIGTLRHVLVRTSEATGQIMVVIVTGTPIFPGSKNFVTALRKQCPEITTVIQNINPQKTSMILGERDKLLYGKGYIEDELLGLTFRLSPASFYQVNAKMTEKLYETALSFANLSANDTVLDAYCGVGTIGMAASRSAGQVIGVELNKAAVRDAIANAKRNGIENIRFFADDASDFLLRVAESGEKLDVVIMDPPRSGSTERFLQSACKVKPKRIVYVSCNPETLARDLQLLKRWNYHCERLVPIDNFPLTEHLETVVLLSKLNTK